VAPGETREDVYEIGLPVDAVQPAGLDQRGEDGPVLILTIRPGEERCIAAATEFLRRSAPWVRRFPEQ